MCDEIGFKKMFESCVMSEKFCRIIFEVFCPAEVDVEIFCARFNLNARVKNIQKYSKNYPKFKKVFPARYDTDERTRFGTLRIFPNVTM